MRLQSSSLANTYSEEWLVRALHCEVLLLFELSCVAPSIKIYIATRMKHITDNLLLIPLGCTAELLD
jgi:hypothetical protein